MEEINEKTEVEKKEDEEFFIDPEEEEVKKRLKKLGYLD
jgi:hypothetical protein